MKDRCLPRPASLEYSGVCVHPKQGWVVFLKPDFKLVAKQCSTGLCAFLVSLNRTVSGRGGGGDYPAP